VIELPLTRGAVALIDDADLPLVQGWKWQMMNTGYAARSTKIDGRRLCLLMHRVIAAPPVGVEVDHINGNRLDNRRENLRLCSRTQNARNKARKSTGAASRFKGVWRNRSCLKWQAGIEVDGRRIHLGLYWREIDAALAYDRAALEHFGEFARTNFLKHPPADPAAA
jgi:hypothetical protein